MLRRLVENLYWIGRYVERAENVARLLDDGFHFELDAAGSSGEAGQHGPVGNVLGILSCRDAFERRPGPHYLPLEGDRGSADAPREWKGLRT